LGFGGSFGSHYLWVLTMAILTSRLRFSRHLLGSVSSAACLFALSPMAFAQITISDATTAPVETDGQDLTIDTAGSVTITTPGPAVTLNSDNAISNAGTIEITDIDNATAVSLEGGANRSFTNSGAINVTEDFTLEDSDGDNIVDGPFAQGSGRTGILISGASPFEGNVELTSTSVVNVEGTDSFGINLANTPMAIEGLTGNLTNDGSISVLGDRGTGINIASDVTGDVINNGNITTQGSASEGIDIAGDIQGGFVNSGILTNTGFRFPTRPGLSNDATSQVGRDSLSAEDLLQAGSAINISSDISRGVLLEDRFEDVLDADGNPTVNENGDTIRARASTSNIVQNGSAPAVLSDGNGTPISIGIVAAITDPAAVGFDDNLQYAFVNQGTIQANGIFDDIDATVFSVADTTLENGFNNLGTLQASTFVAPAEVVDADGVDLTPGDGHARVIVLGPNAIAETINNSGIIIANASEAADAVFADSSNPLAARNVLATTIDIDATANVTSIVNSGGISALLVGRTGEAIGIIDRSGALTTLTNTGTITAIGSSSDSTGVSETSFNLIALDVSANTSGFTLNQSRALDTNPDDNITPNDPIIFGDIRLGTGNDVVTSTAGQITGDIDFNQGNDTFALSDNSVYTGTITNQGGLDISVTDGSTLALATTTPLSLTSATIDATSTYTPTLNGATNSASTLITSGDITIAEGATITPVLDNVVGLENASFSIAQAGGALTVGDINTLRADNSPFLYNTNFAIDPADPNTLLITLDLRDPSTAIADGGLGLDRVQTAAFGSAFTALSTNSELGNAFANITDGQAFNSAFNQILPEFSAAARQFVLANVDGATGAVGTHLDSVRRSPDRPGGAWLEQFAYFADRELAGLSEQYRGSGFGFTGGLDTAWGPFHAVGVNLGFASTEIEDVVGIDEPLDVVTVQAGLYAGWATGNLGVEAYAGGGYNDFEQQRRVRINTFEGSSRGDWSGTHINGSVRAGYDVELSEKFWLRPAVSFDYLRLSENAFTENGDSGIALSVDQRTSETGSATAMFNFGAKFQGKRTWIRPSLRVGYRYEFLNDPTVTNFRFAGLNDGSGGLFDSETSRLQSLIFPDNGIILGFSIAAGSAYSSIGFDLDSDIRDGFIRHTGRVVVRLLF